MRRYHLEVRPDFNTYGIKDHVIAFVWRWAGDNYGLVPAPTRRLFGVTGDYREVSHVIQYAE